MLICLEILVDGHSYSQGPVQHDSISTLPANLFSLHEPWVWRVHTILLGEVPRDKTKFDPLSGEIAPGLPRSYKSASTQNY